MWQASSVEEMLACGRRVALLLSPGRVVLLRGEMGAGKTTLAKGIVEGFGAGGAEDVSSPTFTIMHEYRGQTRVLHLDLYRLATAAEVRAIGVDEWLDDVQDAEAEEAALLLVEWGERFPAIWPEDRVEILITTEGETRRIEWIETSAASR